MTQTPALSGRKTWEGLGSSLLTWIQAWTHHSPLNILQILIQAQYSNTFQERLLKSALLATLKYTKYTKPHSYHAVHYIPGTYLPYSWKFVSFEPLCHFVHLPLPASDNNQTVLFFRSPSPYFFFFLRFHIYVSFYSGIGHSLPIFFRMWIVSKKNEMMNCKAKVYSQICLGSIWLSTRVSFTVGLFISFAV